jgi:hypothetical protein
VRTTSSYSVSLDKTYERKLDLLRERDKHYKGMTGLDAINSIVRGVLDQKVPNPEQEKST